jgi:type II secretory pathway component PulM
MPALPLGEAGKYVAAAYIVFLALVLIYVAIMAARLSRVERELGEMLELEEPGAAPAVEAAADGAAAAALADPAALADAVAQERA